MSVGYSGTPLSRKLGIMSGTIVLPIGEPGDYRILLEPLPEDVRFETSASGRVDIVHFFVTSKFELRERLEAFREALRGDAAVWVSWPKKASRVQTDIAEGTIREVALPLGFVVVKVCAVTEVWSGLKLVVRKELR